jgi:hypothetical protein
MEVGITVSEFEKSLILDNGRRPCTLMVVSALPDTMRPGVNCGFHVTKCLSRQAKENQKYLEGAYILGMSHASLQDGRPFQIPHLRGVEGGAQQRYLG